jgi:hypothetical protein
MEEELIEVNKEFGKELNFDNMLILVLSGMNTEMAMKKLGEVIARPPIIIALNSDPVENQDEIDYSHEFDTDCVREVIRKENEIKEAEVSYIKHFIKTVTSTAITSAEDVERIHNETMKYSRVKASIKIHKCNREGIKLQFHPGQYQDLSSGYERSNNIDPTYYIHTILMRRWLKMIEFFKFVREEEATNKSLTLTLKDG